MQARLPKEAEHRFVEIRMEAIRDSCSNSLEKRDVWCVLVRKLLLVAILAQVASAAWAKVRARVRSAGDGVRAGLGQPATFTRGGAPLRPQIR